MREQLITAVIGVSDSRFIILGNMSVSCLVLDECYTLSAKQNEKEIAMYLMFQVSQPPSGVQHALRRDEYLEHVVELGDTHVPAITDLSLCPAIGSKWLPGGTDRTATLRSSRRWLHSHRICAPAIETVYTTPTEHTTHVAHESLRDDKIVQLPTGGETGHMNQTCNYELTIPSCATGRCYGNSSMSKLPPCLGTVHEMCPRIPQRVECPNHSLSSFIIPAVFVLPLGLARSERIRRNKMTIEELHECFNVWAVLFKYTVSVVSCCPAASG